MGKKVKLGEVGPQNWRDLQQQNSLNNESEEREIISRLKNMYPTVSPVDPYYTAEQDVVSPLAQQSRGEDYWGNSMFDEPTATETEFQNLGDIRAENQPWYAKLGAGVGKMGTTAATTFLSGTLGLAYGLGKWATTGNASAVWNNEIVQGLDDFNKSMEDYLPNYYTQDETENPMAWRNIFSANFLGDKVIKNLGFAIGAFYGGGLASTAIKAARLPQLLSAITTSTRAGKFATGLIGTTVQAAGEASIEAASNTKDFKERMLYEYDAEIQPLYEAALKEYELNKNKQFVMTTEGRYVDPAYEKYKNTITKLEADKQKYHAEVDKQVESMGDRVFLWNMAALIPSGLIQHGKIFARGIDDYRNSLNIKGVLGDYSSATTKKGLIGKIALNAFSESSEESIQGLAAVAEGNIAKAELDAFVEAGMDPKASKETIDKMNIIQQSIVEHFGSDRQKEEALIGGLIGTLGIPTISRRNNGRIGLKLQGGAFSEIGDYRRQVALENKVAAELNERYNSGKMKEYYEGLTRHVKFENDKIINALDNDEDSFNDSELNQLISDIIMFDQVGRLGDLRAMIDHNFDTSDENLQSIINDTSETNDAGEVISGTWVDSNGNPLNSTPEGKQQMIDIITNNKKRFDNAIERYINIKNDLVGSTNGQLSKDQLSELIWLKMKAEFHNDVQKETLKNLSATLRNVNPTVLSLSKESAVNIPELSKLSKASLEQVITDSNGNPIIDSNYLASKLLNINEDKLRQEMSHLHVNKEIIDNIVDNITTIKKSQEKIDKFEFTFEEYKNNPLRQLEHQDLIKQKIKQKEQNKAKNDLSSKIASTSVSEINNSGEDLDGLLDMLESLETTTQEEEDNKNNSKEKIKQAKSIRSFQREAHRSIENSDAPENIKQTAHAAIDASATTANSVDQLLDTEGLAFNDPTTAIKHLPPSDFETLQKNADNNLDLIAQLEEQTRDARILMDQIVIPELESIQEELESIPDNIEDLINEEPETTGHDPVSKIRPITPSVETQSENTPTPSLNEEDSNASNKELFNSNTNNVAFSKVWKSFTTKFPIGWEKGDFRPMYEIAGILNLISEKIRNGESLTFEEQELKNKYVDIYGYLPTYTTNELKRMQAVFNYLKDKNSFTIIETGIVSQGDEIVFVSDPYLNEKAGDIVILIAKMTDSGYTIIGDLMPKSELNKTVKNKRIGDNNPGLEQFINKFEEEYKKYIEGNNITENFVFGKTHINSIMVGKPEFTNELKRSLNEIAGKSDFTLGIIRGTNITKMQIETDARATDAQTKQEQGVIMPKNPKPGQPFLILSTGDKNRYYPVSFTMEEYNENTSNTKLGQIIERLINRLPKSKNIVAWKDTFKDLISVNDIFIDKDDSGNIKISVIPINSDKRTVIYNGPVTDDFAEQVKTKLYGNPFQVSRKYINGEYDADVELGATSYNELIGEIAKTNITNNLHTVNDWFVINPINANGDEISAEKPLHKFSTSSRQDNTSGKKQNVSNIYSFYEGKVNVNSDTWAVTNEKGEPIKDIDTANKFRAYVYGLKNNLLEQEYYDTEWGRYNPKQAKFIKKEELVIDDSIELPDPSTIDAKPVRTFGGKATQSVEQSLPESKQNEELSISEKLDSYLPIFGVKTASYDSTINKEAFLEHHGTSIFSGEKADKTPWNLQDMLDILDREADRYKQALEELQEYRKVNAGMKSLDEDTRGLQTTMSMAIRTGRKALRTAYKLLSEVENSNQTTTVDEQQESQVTVKNQISNIQKAQESGLLDEPIKEQMFSILTEEQQNAILSAKKAKRNTLIKKLASAFDSVDNVFDEDILGGSINELLGIEQQNRATTSEKQVWNKNKELRWLNRVLPQLNKEGRVRIVDSLIRIPNSDKKAWGRFKKGIIDIYDRAASGTLIHEAFHAITNMLLTRQERKTLFNAARDKYGNMVNEALEEKLAEDFRRYVQLEQTPVIGKIIKLFRQIKHIISNIRGNESVIDGLFYRIQRGKLANRNLFDTNNTRYNKIEDISLYIDQSNWLKTRATEKEYNKVFNLKNILKKELFNSREEVVNYMRNIHNINYGNYQIEQYKGRYYARPLMDMTYSNAVKFVNQKLQDAYYEDLSEDELLSREALNEQDELFREEYTNNIRYRVADYITEDTPQEERELLEHSERFLANFGITIEELKNYDSKEPLFDSINKVIYFKNIDDLTDNVGYAVAFMMQYNPIVKDLISYRLVQPKLVKRSLLKRSEYSLRISDRVYNDMNKTQYLKDIGKDIAQELKRIFNVTPKTNHNAFLYRLNQLISQFFDLFSYSMKTQYEVINKFARDVANNIKLNDYTSILLSKNKPGTNSKAELVTLDKAFKDNPYEESIIRNLNKFDISLAGSASMAVQGTVYRPTENPMHDIDFNARGKTEQEIESIIQELYPHNHLKNTIVNGTDKTLTYIVMDRSYEVARPIEGIAEYVIIDSVTKEVIGSYVGSELTLKEGVKGKILDFFIGEKKYPNIQKKVNGKTYLFANAKEALEAKLDWTRLKDIWDYNRFVPFDMQEVLEAERAAQEQEFKNKFESAKIIWGHPAIGKTTYLETRQDILEWDQEVNPKRNEFIRQQIDPKNELSEQEFNNKKREYMANLSPEYVQFLTNEWNNLKNRAKQENKKLFASPLPLLKLFSSDFDLVINLSYRQFYENNTKRGGSHYSTINWKQAIDDTLINLPEEKVFTTSKYFSELMQQQNLDYNSIEIYQLTKYDYNNLSQEDKQYLQDKNIAVEEYMQMSRDEREVLLHCKP